MDDNRMDFHQRRSLPDLKLFEREDDQTNINQYSPDSFADEEEDYEEYPMALIVEDENICQNFLEAQLKDMQIRTRIAATVNEAKNVYLELAAQNISIDVVFLDIMLRDRSTGIEFLKMIRENNWMEKTLIIVMSGIEDVEIVKECYNYSIQNFIRKPITRANFINEKIKIMKYLDSLKCPLPEYKIEKQIGHGAYATVYLVRNKKTKKPYAMKKLMIDDNQSEENEVRFLKNLKSPTILELVDYEFIDKSLYIILEYAEFGTLNDLVQSKKVFSVDKILDWMTQLFIGLLTIHEKNVMHRDIKSENLFMCKNQVLKIGDLGIARAIDSGKAHTVCGTLAYMAPEMFYYQKYDLVIDVWAAGIVLYELCMLKKPFEGSNVDELKNMVHNPNAFQVSEKVDERIRTLLKHCLNPDPHKRASAKDILRLPFMLERVKRLFESKILNDDTTYNRIMEILNKPVNSTTFDGDAFGSIIPKAGNEDNGKLKELYKNFKIASQIEASAVKTTYKRGFFKPNIPDVIEGYYLQLCADDNEIKLSELENLLSLGFIENLINKENKTLDIRNNMYYKVKLFEDDAIENSIRLGTYSINTCIDDPVGVTMDCLDKIQQLWFIVKDFIDYDDFEKRRINFISSDEYFDFLISIKKLKYLQMEKYNKQQKLAIILNIYQTMFIHQNIKNLLAEDETQNKGIIESFLSLITNGSKNFEIIYEVSGQRLSLYAIKNIIIRRNKTPLNAYFKLAYSNDPRIYFIEEDRNSPLLMMKLHLVCQDPNNTNTQEEILEEIPVTIFRESNVYADLEEHCKKAIGELVRRDEIQLTLPKFLKEYQSDLGGNEGEMIKTFLKIYRDPQIKGTILLKQINAGELLINYS